MSRTTLFLPLLIVSLLIIQTYSDLNPNPSKETSTHILEKTKHGYAVVSNLSDKNKKFEAKLLLALYTSETYLVEKNLASIGVTLDKSHPAEGRRSVVAVPSYEMLVEKYSIPVSCDRELWSIKNKDDYVNVVIECRGIIHPECMLTGFGLIGMGKDDSRATISDKKADSFALYKDPSTENFKLAFNPQLLKEDRPQAKMAANRTWHVESQVTYWAFGEKEVEVKGNSLSVIFDLNEEATGLPCGPFRSLMQILKSDFGCNYGDDLVTYPLTCKFQGTVPDISTFPPIIIYIGAGKVNELTIRPSDYLSKAATNDTLNVHLRFISDNSRNVQTYSTIEYNNYIIIGSKFMSQYCTIFNFEDNMIRVYDPSVISKIDNSQKPSGDTEPEKSKTHDILILYGVIFGTVLVVVIIALVLYVRCKISQMQKEVQESTFIAKDYVSLKDLIAREERLLPEQSQL